MGLNCGEGNGVRLAGRTSRNTDRIARTVINALSYGLIVRSVLFLAIARGDGFIDRGL